MSLRFLGLWQPLWVLMLASALGSLAWWLYRREIRGFVSPPWSWILPSLRALAIGFITFTLAEPIIEQRTWEGQPNRLIFALDASSSMSLTDSLSDSPNNSRKLSRYQRGSRALLGEAKRDPLPTQSISNSMPNSPMAWDASVIEQLESRFLVALHRIDGNSQTPNIYDSEHSKRSQPETLDLEPESWSDTTALGDAIHAITQAYASQQNPILVLLSDGQNNAGRSVLSEAEDLRRAGVMVFAVGYGAPKSERDLAILSSEIPKQTFRQERITGSLVVREQIAKGQSYQARIDYDEQCIWKREILSEGNLQREIPFSFQAQAVIEIANEVRKDIELASLPVRLSASISTDAEPHLENNRCELFITVTVQPAKILLIDGRSRWETRYLKNLFKRDPAWELTSWNSYQDDRSGESQTTVLPVSREQLYSYNLVILGDVQPENLDEEFIEWLTSYVADRAGGLILIDGQRHYLRDRGFQGLQSLLPIRWLDGNPLAIESRATLTSAGKERDALRLDEEEENFDRYDALAPLQFVSRVERQPGAEVLMSAENTVERTPLMVFRRYGSGRVLFVASDEFWRWRFAVADQIHTKLWNQLANWIMEQPLSFQGEFVSLDSGAPSYQSGETIEIRSQLRDTTGQPKGEAEARAIIDLVSSDGSKQTRKRVRLQEDDSVPGNYRCVVGELPAGNYRVRIEAPGYPKQALDVESQFTVLSNDRQEQREINCNVELLRGLAESTGGEYFPEQEIGSLTEKLKPLNTGQLVIQQHLLWQSFSWFAVALGLLALEWLLRKAVGLI